MNKLLKYFRYFTLSRELEDFETIHAEIEKAIYFKGTNLWVLIFAILVASVGLNMNSTAVIIGAMLISPLMGPINGMGYSLATYNFQLFKKSINNFTFAVVVSLLTSAVYFFISPVSTAHSELLARTSPTIYDVIIALFGGAAGMLALSSKLKGNVIPGVAIATALMPPICTAGYGLAKLQFNYFFGATYLFVINTAFIALSAMLISQVLKFPITTIIDEKRAKKINRYITLVLLIILVPSIFFGYRLVKNEEFLENSRQFISEVSVRENSYLLDKRVNANTGKIQLIYSGYGLNNESKKEVMQKALMFQLDTSKITISKGTNDDFINEQTQQMLTESEKLKSKLNATVFSLQKTEIRLDSIRKIPTEGKKLLEEIKPLYPQIQSCSYSKTYVFPDSSKQISLVVFETKNGALKKKDKNKIENWIKTRLKDKSTKVIFN